MSKIYAYVCFFLVWAFVFFCIFGKFRNQLKKGPEIKPIDYFFWGFISFLISFAIMSIVGGIIWILLKSV